MKADSESVCENKYIRVAEAQEDEAIEIPFEDDNTILLSTLASTFPGVCGLKYKNAKTESMRALRLADGRLQAPDEGWDSNEVYYCTFPKVNKRKLEDDESGEPMESSDAKKRAVDKSNHDSKNNEGDLIVLGLAWKTTEKELKEYFGQYGELALTEIKTDARTGRSRGFGFIRFEDLSKHDELIGSRHQIDGRWCDVKRSKDEDDTGKPSRGRIFIGRLTKDIEAEDLREYFVKYGEITDCYIPKPHRGFGFVTFKEAKHANEAATGENSIKGVQLYVSNATPKTDMPQNHFGRGRPGPYGYGGPDRYGGDGGYNDRPPRYNDYNPGPYNSQSSHSYAPNPSGYQSSPVAKYNSSSHSGGNSSYGQDYYGRPSGGNPSSTPPTSGGRSDAPTYHTPYASYRDYNPYYRA